MRIALAEFKQETNSFVPFTTTVRTFEDQYLYRGSEMLTGFGKARLEIPGALAALKEEGAEVAPAGGRIGGWHVPGATRCDDSGRRTRC
jgi:microcystin degradation protein MlrC